MRKVFPSQVLAFINSQFSYLPAELSNQAMDLTIAVCGSLLALVELVDHIPSHLFRDSNVFNDVLVAVQTIRSAVRKAEQRQTKAEMLAGAEKLYPTNGLNPVHLIRRALASCPDEAPTSETNLLSFITDKGLRDSFRIDIETVNTILGNGQWKAATVVAGSVIEGLLLWGILQIREHQPFEMQKAIELAIEEKRLERKPDPDPLKWLLPEYIEIALGLKIISLESANQVRLTKNFRNLIHPGREIRLKQKCNRGTALAALAAVEFLTNDLGNRFSQ